ncbi:MAG: YibE/F family protein [Promicromonosporaceae bacterium]|nr:YibE/F family protein [Promicromonosporaceae bacterium]
MTDIDEGPTPIDSLIRAWHQNPILLIITGLILVVTLAGLALLWPAQNALPPREPLFPAHTRPVNGRVLSTTPAPEPFGSLMVQAASRNVEVMNDWEFPADLFQAGDRVRLLAVEGPDPGVTLEYVFFDFNRTIPLSVLGLAFVAVVILVARTKGLAAIVGLASATATVWWFTIPALLAGRNPVAVALVTASAVMFLVVYLSHGISFKSTAALLSTLATITVVTMLGWAVLPVAHIHPEVSGDFRYLANMLPGVSLRGILICGMALAGVGVLNDVTITQAAIVWELHGANPALTRNELARSALRIGRDHIASSVYTIAFALVGASLALLMMVQMVEHTTLDLLSFDEVAQELVAIGVTSIGMVLAIPFSTILAAALMPLEPSRRAY